MLRIPSCLEVVLDADQIQQFAGNEIDCRAKGICRAVIRELHREEHGNADRDA